MIASLDDLRTAITAWNPACVDAGKKPAQPDLAYPVWRFLRAWAYERNRGQTNLSADCAILLRQVVRWCGGELRLPAIPTNALPLLTKAGLEVTPSATLKATAYFPNWIVGDLIDPDHGVDALPRLVRLDPPLPGEGHLTEFGMKASPSHKPPYSTWQSAAQKEASWRTLAIPPGSTCVVVLPTGTGKSLVFQLLAAQSPGLTVVVVPTVALAIDQCRSARELVPDLSPRYFAANDDAESVLESLRQKQIRLLFTSPEACVSGRLRTLLQSFAVEGVLDNFVIDEVHLVETWGAFFRVDFQLLSGVRKKWLEQPGARLRTVLLTATLTPSGREDLRGLFPPVEGGVWWEFLSQRLRPEMVYFDQKFSARFPRDEAVKESLWRLPRPAILYVTEKKDAETWYRWLMSEGFFRVGCFHGDTSSVRRRELLDDWRADRVDLMVATSAFGLGVDKPDVRAVVHACFPEDMNRYYQEVGRGGRDGWSTVCLLLPTEKDEKVAFGLSPKLMTPTLMSKRWEAMSQPEFCRRQSGDDEVWQIDPGAVRTEMLGQRTGQENVLWNKRLLLQLQRAGHLRLLGASYEQSKEDDQASREWIEVELKFNPHSSKVGDLVEGPRKEELASAEIGLRRVDDYLTGRQCVSVVLAALYGDNVQRVCGGCRWCRKHRASPRDCPELVWESFPVVESIPNAILVGGLPDPVTDQAAFREIVRGCFERKRVRRFASTPTYLEVVSARIGELYRGLPPYLKTPYRIDVIDDVAFELLQDERLAVFHLGHVASGSLAIRGGTEVIHWLRPPTTVADIRYALANRGVLNFRLFPGPEDWFRS
jgi:ATP-dependent DNA helicase RecQ